MSEKTYCEAINETLHQLMSEDDRIVIVGACCVSSPWYVGQTMAGIQEKFPDRVIDGPVSENGVTGMAVGMAIAGMRPIVVFPRMDFMVYAMDPIINQAAKWHFMSGGRSKVPIVFWSIINRGGSQGAQHSQDLRWIFKNIPGLITYEAFDAISVGHILERAVKTDNPVMFFDNRDRYELIREDVYSPGVNKTHIQGIATYGRENDPPMPASQSLEKQWFERYGR